MLGTDSRWDCIVKTPMGDKPHTLQLHVAGDGTVTGAMTSAEDGEVMALQEGTFEGQSLKWTMQITKPFKFKVKVAVDLDASATSFAGHGSTNLMGKVPMTGRRSS